MAITTENIKQKEGFKQTEVGVMPEDWEVKKLGILGRVIRGASPRPQGDRRYYGGNIPRLMVEDVTRDGKYVTPIVDFLTEDGAKRSRPCKKGTLTIVCSGTVGIPSFLAVDACIHDGFLALVDINKRVSKDYLYHQLMMLRDQFEISATHGGVFTNLTTNIVNDFQIPLPPFIEQQAIATALSDVDTLLTSLDKLIAKKQDIKQATMQELLTGKTRLPGFSGEWEMKKFEDIFQFLNTANNARSDFSENGDIQYIHYGDIHTKWRAFLDCSRNELPLIHKHKIGNVPFLENGDLVIADASEDYDGIGISVEVQNVTGKRVIAGLHTILLRGNKEVLADGFKGYLQYIPEVKSSLVKAATGISVYGISKTAIKNISIRLPDSLEQQAIATILSAMDAEIVKLEQKRDKTRALKQGMMQELLTGKTRLYEHSGPDRTHDAESSGQSLQHATEL